jgi:hypothetical protein
MAGAICPPRQEHVVNPFLAAVSVADQAAHEDFQQPQPAKKKAKSLSRAAPVT